MRERHPIDDIFRRGLAAAEVEPPASVWAGVLRQRAGRHRLVVVWRRFRWMGLLALLIGAPLLWWVRTDAPARITPASAQAPAARSGSVNAPMGASDRSSPPAGTVPVPAHATTSSTPSSSARIPDATTAPGATTSRATDGRSTAAVAPDERARPSTAPVGTNNHFTAAERIGHERSSTRAQKVPERERTSSKSTFGGSAAGVLWMTDRLSVGDAEPMTGRRSALAHGMPAAAPGARNLPASYVLPRADWWLAVVAGRFDRSRLWKGSDPELVSARTAVEGHTGEWLWGLWAGRRWRSGTWFGAGVEHTGGRSTYERFDQSQQVSALVNTSIAIFENIVLATQSDTLFVVQERAETTVINGRSSTWRVPLLLGWERGVRRWVFGAHLGLAVEWQRMRDGYLFVEEWSEGGTVVQRTERVRDADRSFGLVSAQLALDGGFQLTEHWRITAGPVYQAGLGVVIGEGAVQALPTRLGGQLRLSVDLPHRNR